MHVVHAPNFPHAAVADVNVHCILPATIKSLAVAFLRGGGGELPGMGDPIEDMYEVRDLTFFWGYLYVLCCHEGLFGGRVLTQGRRVRVHRSG